MTQSAVRVTFILTQSLEGVEMAVDGRDRTLDGRD